MDLNLARETIAMHRLGDTVPPDRLLLAAALAKDHSSLVQALGLGAEPNSKTHQADALTLACYLSSGQDGDALEPEIADCLRSLILAGAKLDGIQTMTRSPCTLLASLALAGRLTLCEVLLDGGADINAGQGPKSRGRGIADLLVRNDRPAALRGLIGRGLDFKSFDRHGDNPLGVAAELGRFECLQILMDAGADLLERGPTNRMPLIAAMNSNDARIRALAMALEERMELAANPKQRPESRPALRM